VACEAKYGAAYRAYEARTGMFLPRALVGARRDRGLGATLRSPAALGIGYVIVLSAALALAFGLRSFALSEVTSLYTKNIAVLSPAVLSSGELSEAFGLAMADSQVQGTLRGKDPQSKLIVYVIPAGWYLPDLPVEVRHELGGHRTPADFDRRFYKVLITKARSSTPGLEGPQIVTHSFGRDPLILARVDLGAAKVTGTELPPAHVVWGDIPTPMF
jgi:hypothetical protein